MKQYLKTFSLIPSLVAGFFAATSSGCSTTNNTPSFTKDGHDAGQDVVMNLDAQPSDDVKHEAQVCGGEVQHAALVPLDLYLMLDRSGSMLLKTSSGVTKWDATKQAIISFSNNNKMESLNLALQYFPFYHPGVPDSCSKDPDCKGFGPCLHPSICSNHFTQGNIVTCNIDDDCTTNSSSGQCLPRGTCSNDANKVCLPEFQQACSGSLGDCVQVLATCEKRQSCESTDYATPAIDMLPRDEFAKQLQANLAAHLPQGQTPTGPALAGALQFAKTYRTTHPKDRPVVVLVTDGLPTDCAPTKITDIAAMAAAETPDTLTYVIGVFDDEMAKTAQSNLDQIAKAGGTDHAIIIKTSTNVAKAFTKALLSIREMAIDCAYEIPKPTTGPLHYDEVNVHVAEDGQDKTLPYVAKPGACSAAGGGWYYDQDPETGQTPTQILLCEGTCSSIQGKADAKVSIELGCPTILK